jgi:phage tail-like protein
MSTREIDARAACRFYVQVDGVPKAVFSELSGLSMEVDVDEVEEGGNNTFIHRLPGRCKTGNLTLKRGLTNSNDFLKWSHDVVQGKINPKNLSVILYNVDGTEAMRWTFTNAIPVKWSGPHFRADDTAAAIESIELAHEGFEIG